MIVVELYQSPPGRKGARAQTWRWKATAGNNKKLAMSSEAYTNRTDCLDAITTLFGNTTDIVLHQPGQPDQPLRTAEITLDTVYDGPLDDTTKAFYNP